METAETERETLERVGLPLLAEYPELLERATVLAERGAERYRAAVGDFTADAVTTALQELAVGAARHGVPSDEDDRAAWVTVTVRAAVSRERDRARVRWTPRRRETAPTDAPNALENWGDDALIRHAERYTNGRLANAMQARAVIDGRAESPVVAPPRRMKVGRHGGSTLVYGAPRTAAPSAESDYWRGRWHGTLRAMVDAVPAFLAAADAYREERRRVRRGDPTCPVGTVTRSRYVAWEMVRRTLGASDRGSVARSTRSTLRAMVARADRYAALSRARIGRAAPFAVEVPAWLYRWAIHVPVAVFAPPVPTALRATLPAVPPVARAETPLSPFSLAACPTGDGATFGTYRDDDDAPVPFDVLARELAVWLAERESAAGAQ